MTTKTAARTVRPVRATPATMARASTSARAEPAPPQESQYLTCGPLTVEVAHVDADMAQAWLANNSNNRTMKPKSIAAMIRDMNNGHWVPVGDPIRFTLDEDIADGQHRLQALTQANPGIILPMLVVRGVHPEHRHVIDTGARRSAADQLRIAGYSNYVLLSAAAKWSIIVERLRADAASARLQRAVTHSEILDYVTDNALLHECVAVIANNVGKRIDIPSGYICAAYYQMALIHEPDADEFIARLADGVSLSQGDGVLALRDFTRDARVQNVTVTGDAWLSLMFRAWNARRSGESVRKLIAYDPRTKDLKERKPIPMPTELI